MLTPAHRHADVHLNREQCWTAPLKLSCLSRAAGDKRFHQSINTAGEPADRQADRQTGDDAVIGGSVRSRAELSFSCKGER